MKNAPPLSPLAGLARAVAVVAALAAPASGAETQWWTTDTASDYSKAESRGVVVRPDGVLEPGPESRRFPADSLRTIWAIAPLADGSIAIAGDHGRIERWVPGQGIRPWARLGSGQVLCLLPDGDGVLAGTGPRGLVYRVSASGDTTLLSRTGERYVWGLARAGPNAWWAATGTRGRLLRIERGVTRVVLDSEESNLVSLVPDGKGGAYAGGDSRGVVVHALAGGGVRTVFDATEDEVRALALGADGALWAAALSVSAVTEPDAASDTDEDRTQPAKGPIAGGRAVLYRIVPDSVAVAWWTSPQPLVYALASTTSGVLAATGNRAGVFRIERSNGAALLLALPEGQVTALAIGRGGATFAATSNPASLWQLGPGAGTDGVLIAAANDARRFARFGRLRWNGSGRARFSTRSGNSETADTTWSPWQAVDTGDDGGAVASPPARFLQWKVALESADARVNDVSVAWREQNLPPRVEDLTVAAQGQGLREGELSTRSDAVTQMLPGGQKVEYSVSTGSQRSLRELPIWARGLRTLQWRGTDTNGDALRYRVEIRPEDGDGWITIGKDLDAPVFTWNTIGLPDGRYRARVTASDAQANAVGEERSGDALSEPFTVDNAAPTVTALTASVRAGSVRIDGAAEDDASPIGRLEASVDDGNWRLVAPEGGLADRRRLRFSSDWPGLAPGPHTVSVRAVDLAGNSATRAVRVQVPAGR